VIWACPERLVEIELVQPSLGKPPAEPFLLRPVRRSEEIIQGNLQRRPEIIHPATPLDLDLVVAHVVRPLMPQRSVLVVTQLVTHPDQ
jgi:hypothetical protein